MIRYYITNSLASALTEPSYETEALPFNLGSWAGFELWATEQPRTLPLHHGGANSTDNKNDNNNNDNSSDKE